ncbi:MAG TPA: acyl-CoA dehydrogenase family protein [Solirubrobacterales bacterium]|nr:acyl-CoA dehydrogenase family protein [Solirubrobacterales bacterium]
MAADRVLERAAALRPQLIERQAETERLTFYPQQTHEALLEAGLYRTLVPRAFGGLELDVPTFARLVIELARGCMSTAWCFALGAGHALQIGSWFDLRAQEEIFGDGEFRCASAAAPAGSARPDDDGWAISGTFAYCSGAPYATHYMGQTFAPAAPGEAGKSMLLFVAPRSEWTMLDDWHGALGLRGSGSHSVEVDAQVPSRHALAGANMLEVDVDGGTPGSELHGNPMYAGRALSFFAIELSAVAIGAAWGAIDDYERMLRSRKTSRPPIRLRGEDGDYQRWLGDAVGLVSTAEAALLSCADQWTSACVDNVEGGGFSREEDLRLDAVARESMRLASRALQDHVFRTAGSSSMRSGERLERAYRDLSMAWGHGYNTVGDWVARQLGAARLGIGADEAGAGGTRG